MAWGRIDGELAFHPKIVSAGNAAIGVWARMIAHSNRYLTDGFIDRAVAHVIGSSEEIARLLAKHLLHEVDGGYLIHDFHDYNPTADEVRSAQAETSLVRSASGKKGGIASGIARRRAKQSEAKCEANIEAKQQAKPKQNEAPDPDPVKNSLPRARNGSEPYTAKRFHDTWFDYAQKTPTGEYDVLVAAAERCEKSAALFKTADVDAHARSLIGAFIRLIQGWKDAKTKRPQLSVEAFLRNFAACEETLTGERDPREAVRVNGHAKQPNATAAAAIAAMAREVAGGDAA